MPNQAKETPEYYTLIQLFTTLDVLFVLVGACRMHMETSNDL